MEEDVVLEVGVLERVVGLAAWVEPRHETALLAAVPGRREVAAEADRKIEGEDRVRVEANQRAAAPRRLLEGS